GADDVELSHAGATWGMSRFAGSTLTQAGVVEERTTRVRIAIGGRVGAATTSGMDGESLDEAAGRAAAAARLGPSDPQGICPPTPAAAGGTYVESAPAGVAAGGVSTATHATPFTGFARPSSRIPRTPPTGFIDATAAFTSLDRAALLGRIFARAAKDDLTCAGSFTTGARRFAVATAGGAALAHRISTAALSLICTDGDASGYACSFPPDVRRLDHDELAERAVEKAVRSRDPIDLVPQPLDVVLEPPAVVELCEWMAMASF